MAGEIKDDSVEEFKDFLSEESSEESNEEEVEVESPDEDSSDETEEESSEETEETKEGEEKEEKLETKDDIEVPKYKEIINKYPNLFKDFPHLKHTFFHAKEYREIFPTVEDAKEAVESLDTFKELEESLTSGDEESTVSVLKSISELGDEALPNFASNFMASIRKVDQQLYYSVITPELVNFTRSMYNAGLRNENDNIKNAALVAAQHFFGDMKIASGEKEVKLPEKANKKDESLENERKAFQTERYRIFYNDVQSEADTKLNTLIMDGIDPGNKMSPKMKEMVSKEVQEEISQILGKNSIHVKRMNSLWNKAKSDKYTNSHKTKIIATYIEAAKEIMPRIRSKVRSSVLGIRDRHSESSNSGVKNKRIEPNNNAGGGRQSQKSNSNSNSNGNGKGKAVDWKKTSDLDFLKDNVSYK